MFQASIVYSQDSSLLMTLKHKTKVNIHWILNTLAVICILIAYICIYVNKEQNSKPHLVSWHGIFGLIAIVYACIQWFAGHFLTLLVERVRPIIPYSKLKRYHAFSGLLLYFFMSTALILGLFSNWFQTQNSSFIQYLCVVCVLLSLLVVLNQIILKYITKKSKTQGSF
jgi:cytochrome b-561 domain-containing protein 2